MRKLLLALSLLSLAGCTTPADPRVGVLESCNAYDRSLAVLAGARSQGLLTPAQVHAVDLTIPPAASICASPVPPANATTVLDGFNAQLEQIIFESGVKQ